MPEIRACLFDMGNVLLHFSHDVMVRQMADVCRCEPARLKSLLFDSGLLLEYERGLLTEEELHLFLEDKLNSSIPRLELEQAAARIFTQNEEMVPLLEALKANGYPLILLSNTSRVHFDYIRASFPMIELFDHFTLSYQVQEIKPDPAIYQHAIRQAGVPARNCFFTDDIAENVLAARNCGLQAEQFLNATQLAEHLRELGLPLSR